ncbi:hypothetical protein C8R43DRAFT_1117839 [Mycena crocata]|nr:hypothetical protein C8R43DRAFT_1117839 [Mycena crocata]
MPDFEIYRPREYWANVHRRAREARLIRKRSDERAEAFTPMLSDGQTVVTFVPGRTQPFTSVVHPSGRLIPVQGPGPSSRQPESLRLLQQHTKHRREEESLREQRAAEKKRKADQADQDLVDQLAGVRRRLDSKEAAAKKARAVRHATEKTKRVA